MAAHFCPSNPCPYCFPERAREVPNLRVVIEPEVAFGIGDPYLTDQWSAALDEASARFVASLRDCAYCGRPFAPASRSDEIYCRRLVPAQTGTCAEVGPGVLSQARRDPWLIQYRLAYKRLDSRVRRNGHDRTVLNKWCELAHSVTEDAQAKSIPVDIFRFGLLRLADELGLVGVRARQADDVA